MENTKILEDLAAVTPNVLLEEYDSATSLAEELDFHKVCEILESLPKPLLEKFFKNNGFIYET